MPIIVVLVKTMIALNHRLAEIAAGSRSPEEKQEATALCRGFIKACEESIKNMEGIIESLGDLDGHTPEDMERFELDVLRDLTSIPVVGE